MKKMMILLMIMTAGLASPVFAAAPDSVTNPSFEDNTAGVCNNWVLWGESMAGLVYHTGDAANANTGTSYFEIGRGTGGWAGIHTGLDQCVAVVSGEDATLSAAMRLANGATTGSATLKFEFYATQNELWVEGGTPNTVMTFPLTNSYTVYSLTTAVPAGMNFARATIVSEAGASFYIDDVSIPTGPVTIATLVSPANNSFVSPVSGTVNLVWINALPKDPNDVADRCDVWFSVDNADPATGTKIVNNLAVETVPATIGAEHDYYWRVDCIDPNRPDLGGAGVKTIGDVWMFTTKNTGPTATAGFDENAWLNGGSATVILNPQYSDVDNYPGPLTRTITVLPTANASFDINPTTGVDPNAITFTAAGTYTITLDVSDGALTASDSFVITVYPEGTAENYLVAHYPFDTNASDTSGNAHHGTLTGNAVITTADKQVGAGALSLDGTGDFVSIADSVNAVDPNLITWADFVTAPNDEVTVAAWIKPALWATAYTQIVSKGYPGGYRFTRPLDYNGVVFATDQLWTGGAVYGGAQYVMGDGKWHQVVGTWDGGALALYIDGNFQYRLPQEPGTTLIKNNFHLQIGANESADSTQHFNGLIDDVRIYSRGLSHAEVLKLYAAQGGRGTCGLTYADADLNRDCVVNLSDLALFASQWLDCRDVNPFGCQ